MHRKRLVGITVPVCVLVTSISPNHPRTAPLGRLNLPPVVNFMKNSTPRGTHFPTAIPEASK